MKNNSSMDSKEEVIFSSNDNMPTTDADINIYHAELGQQIQKNTLLTEKDRKYMFYLMKCASQSVSDDTTAAKCSESGEASTNLGRSNLVQNDKMVQTEPYRNIAPLLNYLKEQSQLKDEQDAEGIESAMSATFLDRQNFILNRSPRIEHLRKVYPMLFDGHQLIVEFERLTATNVAEVFYAKLKLYYSSILQCAQPTSSTMKSFSAAEKNANSVLKKQYVACACALLTLPSLFDESLDHFIKFNTENPNTIFPIICCSVDMENCLTEMPELKIYAEKHYICQCSDLTEAFLIFMAAYYVFNIKYSSAVSKTTTLIETLLLDIPTRLKERPVIKRVKNAILSKHN